MQGRPGGIVFTEPQELSHPVNFDMVHERAEMTMHVSIWQLFAGNVKLLGKKPKIGYGAVDCNHNDIKVHVLASLVQTLAGDPAELKCVTNQLDHDKICMHLSSVVSYVLDFIGMRAMLWG